MEKAGFSKHAHTQTQGLWSRWQGSLKSLTLSPGTKQVTVEKSLRRSTECPLLGSHLQLIELKGWKAKQLLLGQVVSPSLQPLSCLECCFPQMFRPEKAGTAGRQLAEPSTVPLILFFWGQGNGGPFPPASDGSVETLSLESSACLRAFTGRAVLNEVYSPRTPPPAALPQASQLG